MTKPWYAYSDHELGIKGQWFTGKEWADGTAERESRREFYRAISEAGENAKDNPIK